MTTTDIQTSQYNHLLVPAIRLAFSFHYEGFEFEVQIHLAGIRLNTERGVSSRYQIHI